MGLGRFWEVVAIADFNSKSNEKTLKISLTNDIISVIDLDNNIILKRVIL